ncbi:MAG: diaminopimelate decarboxylase [Ruminococcaceae bacterium]|nr:diaminopimelate decarboxylase [Oscillospiraceae bacterium]
MICNNLSINSAGHLTLGGADTVALANKYGTPLYIMDEDRIRERCRTYKTSMARAFGDKSYPLFASKAASFKQIYRIIMEEGLGTDLVSSGELYTATSVGFPLAKAYFHSNNKTDADIAYAIDRGVGYFVVDNVEELDAIDKIAGDKNVKQKILLRLTPGIDPHTYEAVTTGKVDSKFGSAIETGQAEQIAKYATELSNIVLYGFHCHVGSQVFDSDVFLRASEIMLDFIALMSKKYGFVTRELDLGGGYGVRYLDSDPEIDIAENIAKVGTHVKAYCHKLGIDMPEIRMEPGRSIVADAGLTLYTAGTVKRIPGYKNYVSVDGGMADNPRYALYRSPYTVCLANRMDSTAPTFNCTLAGRCCESGDLIQENVTLPADIKRGDMIAVLTTGAYNYSMASNYNRLPKPPIVMVKDGKEYIAVKRESLEDICKNDI